MSNEDETIWIILNGEIYNYIELRMEPCTKGLCNSPQTDNPKSSFIFTTTEGPACLDQFNGMFAFAIWDKKKQVLFAARESIRHQALLLCVQWGHLRICLNKSIAESLSCRIKNWTLHPLQIISHSSFCLGDKTLFKGISKLLPGHYILVPANGRISFHTYWDLYLTVDFHHTEEYFQETLCLLPGFGAPSTGADVTAVFHSVVSYPQPSGLPVSAIHTFSGGFKEGLSLMRRIMPVLWRIEYIRIYHEILGRW